MVSGENLIKFLSKRGFEIRTQSSSHIVLQKDWRVFSVPLHSELKKGTLLSILKQAGVEIEDFKRELL